MGHIVGSEIYTLMTKNRDYGGFCVDINLYESSLPREKANTQGQLKEFLVILLRWRHFFTPEGHDSNIV